MNSGASTQKIALSVVVPAYNEEHRIRASLDRIVAYLVTQNISSEVIVVDDGSTDQTVVVSHERLGSIPHKILSNGQNRGKGFSVRQGMLAAQGEIVLFTDADLSTPIEECEKLIRDIQNGSDLAIGSRDVSGSKVERHQNILREFMGKVFNRIAHVSAFRGIHDSQCGFKAFKHNVAQKLFTLQKINGFCFDAEIIFLAQRLGYRVGEVGVRWINSPQSKVRIIRDSVLMFVDLCRIRLLHLKTKA
jgi:dolichyl-phosphate beta-glucosyltransferase